jgi:hypothetical protein
MYRYEANRKLHLRRNIGRSHLKARPTFVLDNKLRTDLKLCTKNFFPNFLSRIANLTQCSPLFKMKSDAENVETPLSSEQLKKETVGNICKRLRSVSLTL